MMDKVKVKIGDKVYHCKVAKTQEEKRKGLQHIEFLPKDEGMLFVWDEEDTREMWMKDCFIELDIIGIDEDNEVNTVIRAIPEDETLLPFIDAKYILEVNANSGIIEGDEFEIDDSDDLNKYTMKVLAPDNTTQMLLQGGERIFSRKSSKQIIAWAKKANLEKNNKSKFENYCRKLGKRVFRELKAQDTREPEYVSTP